MIVRLVRDPELKAAGVAGVVAAVVVAAVADPFNGVTALLKLHVGAHLLHPRGADWLYRGCTLAPVPGHLYFSHRWH